MSDRLGPVQRPFLRNVVEISDGRWWFGCGWYWKNDSYDQRVARSLVRRGFLVEAEGSTARRRIYEITPAGKRAAAM